MALFPPIDLPPDEVRALLAPLRNDFSVAIHSLSNGFSVGAIIRVAHSFLAREIFVVGEEPYYAKASMGMEKYEAIERLTDDDAFFARVRGRPVWAIEKDFAKRSVYEVKEFPEGVVLALGSERAGLSRAFVARADEVLAIPMYGVNHSFPVAVAAGIVMSEWARRRYGPGATVPRR